MDASSEPYLPAKIEEAWRLAREVEAEIDAVLRGEVSASAPRGTSTR